MKKVFTLLSPTLFKSTSLLLCLFVSFSQSVFSLDEITNDSTDIKVGLEPASAEQIKKSESLDKPPDVKTVKELSEQTLLSDTNAQEHPQISGVKKDDLTVPATSSNEFLEQNETITTHSDTAPCTKDVESDIEITDTIEASLKPAPVIIDKTEIPKLIEKSDIFKNNTEKITITKAPQAFTDKIRVNEILSNPKSPEKGAEFIELYNASDNTISVNNWYIYYKSKTSSTSKKHTFDDIAILNDDFLLIYPSFSLINKSAEIILYDSNDTEISKYTYLNTSDGYSWNYDEDVWYEEQSTPGKENNENPLTKKYPEILINEILPNPKDSQDNEFIELYNPTNSPISLQGWTLKDASKTGYYTFPYNETEIKDSIPSHSYFLIPRSSFRFALNNSGSEVVSLIAPNGKIMDKISYNSSRKGLSLNRATQWYWTEPTPNEKNAIDPRTIKYLPLFLSEFLPNPSGAENTDEFIEIYNPNNIKVNLKNWLLKDASKTGSHTFTDDIFIAPHAYFVIYRKDFSFALNNSNETVSLIAPNEKVMSSISYKSSREDISYNYNYISKSWRWSKYLTPGKQNIFNNIPTITKFDIDKNSYKNVYTNFKVKATDKDNEKLKVRWDFGDGRKSYLWKTRHKYTKTGLYYGSLRIQDESEEIIKKFTVTVKKYPKHKIKITKIVPNPSGKDSGIEYIIIKNESKEKINLQNWSLATGVKEKTLVNHPIYDKLILKPGKTKKITKKYTAISLPNKTGVIEIRRPNGSVADKQKYGHKDISIKDNSSFELIDGVWIWTIPVDLEKQYQTQQIISQAIKNEKIFSQQILENKVAISAVYNSSHNASRDIVQTNSNLFVTLLQNINSLLHKTILMAQSFSETLKSNQVLAYSYTPTQIDLPTQPCEKPYLFTTPTSQKFDLCK